MTTSASDSRRHFTDPLAAQLTRTSLADRKDVAAAFVVGLVGIALLALRAPFAIRQLWAEDGSIFLQDALNDGVFKPIAQAYAGYFHFVPRLIGGVASLVPLSVASFATWSLVVLMVGWCVGTVFYASKPWVTSRASRSLLALSLVLLPALGAESIANAANLQFILLFSSLVVVVGPPRGPRSSVNNCVLVMLTGLTTPLTIFLLPLIAVRMSRRGRPYLDPVVLSWLGGLVVQLLAMAIARPDRSGRSSSFRSIAAVLGGSVPLETFSPVRSSTTLVLAIAGVVVGSLIALAAIGSWRIDRLRSVLLIAVPLVGGAMLVFLGRRTGLPPRYHLLPAWCLLWASLVSVDAPSIDRLGPAFPVRARTLGRVVLHCSVLLGAIAGWQPSSWRSEGPTWRESRDVAAQLCLTDSLEVVDVDIAPQRASSWRVRVPCDSLD